MTSLKSKTRLSLESDTFLNQIFERYHHSRWIGKDPLAWPRAYASPADREVVGFIASSLAYGNVVQIDRSLNDLLARLGRSPAKFARNFCPGRDDSVFDGFYHRFNTSRDLALLIHLIGQMLRKEGSIENFWQSAQSTSGNPEPLEQRAGRFMDAVLQLETAPYHETLTRGSKVSALYLLPDIGGSSACKRFFLFLRWMVRPDDGVDLGLWHTISPAELEVPVDTHILRLSRYLGATTRQDASARTRREITAFLKQSDPEDPVRFDFSLCRLGIEKICPTREDVERCRPCELQPICLRHQALLYSGRLPRRLARLGLLTPPRSRRGNQKRLSRTTKR